MLASLESALHGVARRLRRERWRRAAWLHLVVGLLLAGVGIVLARTALDLERAAAATLLLGLLLVPATALWRARRGEPTAAGLASWLDLRAGGDGAIVTALEREDPRWGDHLERALRAQPEALTASPAPSERPALRVLPAVAFVALALWLEIPDAPGAVSPRLFEGAALRLEEKLETLEELVELEPELDADLRERLERLEAEAREGTPESFFEAADTLERSMETAAEELAARASAVETQLASAAGEETSEGLDAEESLRDALSELDELGFDADLTEALGAERLQSLALDGAPRLDPELAKQLSEALRERLSEKLRAMQEAGLVDPAKLRKLQPGELAKLREAGERAERLGRPCSSAACEKAGECSGSKDCDGEGACHAAECMKAGECQGGAECESTALAACQRPGRGGPSRGRGDAELTWGDETRGDTDAFELHALPPAALEDLESAGLLGVGRGAPTPDPRAEGAGLTETTASGGSSAWRRRLSPSHRRAVRTFFSKE